MDRPPLRRGWTTGACAAAAARAACEGFLTGQFPDPVRISLPGGSIAAFALAECGRLPNAAVAAIVKDAGDDPDVTHGALIRVTLSVGAPGSGVIFRAGPGVGTVTLPGLPVPPGEPAINPVPRRMIGEALAEAASLHGGGADWVVEVSIPGGEALAERLPHARHAAVIPAEFPGEGFVTEQPEVRAHPFGRKIAREEAREDQHGMSIAARSGQQQRRGKEGEAEFVERARLTQPEQP